MTWKANDYVSNGREVDKCRERLKKYCVGIGLDIGCGSIVEEKGFPRENKVVPHAVGIDKGYTNFMGPADDLHWFKDETLDFLFSSHLLEHLQNYEVCLKEWWRVLKIAGYLVLYLPHADYYPNVGTGLGNPDHKHDFKPKGLLLNILDIFDNFEIIHIQEHDENNEYSFDFVIRKTL